MLFKMISFESRKFESEVKIRQLYFGKNINRTTADKMETFKKSKSPKRAENTLS